MVVPTPPNAAPTTPNATAVVRQPPPQLITANCDPMVAPATTASTTATTIPPTARRERGAFGPAAGRLMAPVWYGYGRRVKATP